MKANPTCKSKCLGDEERKRKRHKDHDMDKVRAVHVIRTHVHVFLLSN